MEEVEKEEEECSDEEEREEKEEVGEGVRRVCSGEHCSCS